MTKVVVNGSVSLDGYSAGPNVGEDHPRGEGGERLQLVPVLLGGGSRLLDGLDPTELEAVGVAPGDDVVHLRFRVLR
ncbi:hypothetical protein ACWEFJ_17685 [Actinosynnema sp. NPDC004786]